MNKFSVGLIGCGNIGGKYDERDEGKGIYTHAGIYRNVEGFELICASEISQERLGEFGRFWKISKLYTDYRKMLANEKMDILSVATPDETHSNVILDVLGINPPRLIFTEKPLAMDSNSARKIILECRKKNVGLIVDYMRRWDSNHCDIKKFINDSNFDPIQTVTTYYVRGIRHNGCQIINLIHFFFGTIKEVQALGESKGGSLAGDPSINLRVVTERGVEVNMVAVDRKGYGYSIFEMDILGFNKRLRISNGGEDFELYIADRHKKFPNFNNLKSTTSAWQESTYDKAMIMVGKELYQLMNGDGPCKIHESAIDAYNDLLVIEAALESAKANGKVVYIEKNGWEEI